MDTSKNKFYVTTPIYYVTAKPHLGSLYSTLLADVAARWHKLLGNNVFFLTGTDEHGQKIAQAAEKAGMEPKKFVDQFIPEYQKVWKEYEIDYSYFIRTTDEGHKKAVQLWLSDLIKKGFIYKAHYEGWYCISCETFVTSESDEAPVCPSCGRQTERLSEESYFFKLSAFEDKLLTFYAEHPEFMMPKERAKEVINFVKSGLKDLSISRKTITWGIPFPGDDQHVTYVWADALNNYITAIGYGQKSKEKDFAYWWPADLQVLGKDIVRFHAVYWPAFLMASGLPIPKHLLVHGWIKMNDQKMSKSFGNVVDPQVLYQQYGPDPVRYYLMREMSPSQDTEFSIAHLEQRISSDLANDLGNLLNRMTALAEKNSTSTIAAPKIWGEKAIELRDAAFDMLDDIQELMVQCQYHLALAEMWRFISKVNAYFHEQEPWKQAKQNPAQFLETLSATCHALRIIGYVVWPFMPQKMEALLASLAIPFKLEGDIIERLSEDVWHHTFKIHKIETLFIKPEPRKEEVMELPIKEEHYIDITDFAKVELLVGTIIECHEVPGSDKLYQLKVDLGAKGMRQVLSGVRKHFKPEELIGKQGVFVANLQPRKMVGLESQGMMLFAQDADGKLKMLTLSGQVPAGQKVQ